MEYYPNQNKIFLKEIYEKIKGNEDESSDLILHDLIESVEGPVEYVAFDVPLQLPKCMRCNLKCPGYEVCTEPEIKWLRKNYLLKNLKSKPRKVFTPYTERCVENYLTSELEEIFHPPHALGANAAPLTARAHFISRRISTPAIENFPKLSLWRIGKSLGVQKSYLRSHKHAVDGEEVREAILRQLIDKDIAFIYAQDVRAMIKNSYVFDAFVGGLTAVLKFNNQVEKRPRGFPKGESWVEIPKDKIVWP